MCEITVSAKVGECIIGLAHRLKDNPGFMAYILSIYQMQEYLDDESLAEHFGITVDMLARLALCKCPSVEPGRFDSQIRQIASYVSIEPALLADVIRQVNSANETAVV